MQAGTTFGVRDQRIYHSCDDPLAQHILDRALQIARAEMGMATTDADHMLPLGLLHYEMTASRQIYSALLINRTNRNTFYVIIPLSENIQEKLEQLTRETHASTENLISCFRTVTESREMNISSILPMDASMDSDTIGDRWVHAPSYKTPSARPRCLGREGRGW